MRPLLVWLLTLAVLAACKAKADTNAPTPSSRVTCVPVETRPLRDIRTVRGTVSTAPDRDAMIAAQVSGRLLKVSVREGDVVEKDAVVAEVESRAAVDAMRQADARLVELRAVRETAAAEQARQEHLVERGISARQTLEVARSSLAQADAQIASASAQADTVRQGVERAQVRAPLAGVVVKVFRRTGEIVDGTSASPILEIADTTTLELVASVPPIDLVVLRGGQHASTAFDALPGQRFTGSVRSVSPAVDPASGLGGVRVLLDASDAGTRPPLGLAGQTEIEVSEPRPALVVPAVAVRNAGGSKTEVVVCAGGKADVREVETGLRRDGGVEITKGVDANARVVTDGLGGLETGALLEEKR